MATTQTVEIASLLTRTPGVSGGQLCLAGTRMRVIQVAAFYRAGMLAESIADDYSLPAPQVHAAIAYYLANRERLDAEIEADRAEHDRMAELYPPYPQPQPQP